MSGQLEFGEDLRRAWDLSLHMLATKVSKVTFETYIRPTQPLSYVDNVVKLGVASPFAREWLEKKAANPIRSALEFHLDVVGLEIQFVVMSRETHRNVEGTVAKKPDSPSPAARPRSAAQPMLPLEGLEEVQNQNTPPTAAPSAEEQSAVSDGTRPQSPPRSAPRKPETRRNESGPVPIPSLPLNERYVFDTFVVGRSNRLAHAGANSVASRPGEAYNPLFLYGGPGLGKTHLLHGIAHTLHMTQPELRVAYVSGEYFAQHYIRALQQHSTEDFRRQYRQVDVWLVDDVQFIAGKEATKEEFFHTFNALYQAGKQIVIASDRSPRELNTMDERLRSRFQSGLIADIAAPEQVTRFMIMQQYCLRENVRVPEDVLEYIASAIQSNIRALQGALTKLIAYSSIMNTAISPEMAQGVLSEYFIEKPIRLRRVSIDDVVEAVADKFGLAPAAIKGPSRNKDVSLARQVAMYVARELLPEQTTMILGAEFGGRDHATIVYACQKLKTLMEVDPDLKAMVTSLIKTLPG